MRLSDFAGYTKAFDFLGYILQHEPIYRRELEKRFAILPPTAIRTLMFLMNADLIREDPAEGGDGRVKFYYRLTERGKRFAKKLGELEEIISRTDSADR